MSVTTMDHPPREMKETLFTRHNQTVVPLLANTKKASLQAVHTSFVNTAIDNMTENRVLNYRPPPINDEETYLTRRQRATLSQLRTIMLYNSLLVPINTYVTIRTPRLSTPSYTLHGSQPSLKPSFSHPFCPHAV